MTNSNQDEFLKEVLSLFASEAGELLVQVKEAIGALETGVDTERQRRCVEAMLRGLSTLGGSAATAGLTQVEQLTFALLPLIEHLQAKGTIGSGPGLSCLKTAVGTIEAVAGQLAEGGDGSIRDLETRLKQITEAVGAGVDAPASADSSRTSRSAQPPDRARRTSASPLDALRDLHKRQEASSGVSRHILDAVIKRAQDASHGTAAPADAKAITSWLRDMDQLDEWFLSEVQSRMPEIEGAFSLVQAGTATADQTDEVVEAVVRLQAAAQKAEATAIMQFFQGLHGFLSITAKRRVDITAARFQAVQTRLTMIARLAQRWVQLGRQERSAIEQRLTDVGLLPA